MISMGNGPDLGLEATGMSRPMFPTSGMSKEVW